MLARVHDHSWWCDAVGAYHPQNAHTFTPTALVIHSGCWSRWRLNVFTDTANLPWRLHGIDYSLPPFGQRGGPSGYFRIRWNVRVKSISDFPDTYVFSNALRWRTFRSSAYALQKRQRTFQSRLTLHYRTASYTFLMWFGFNVDGWKKKPKQKQ